MSSQDQSPKRGGKWGGARPGAGRPAKQPGHRRVAISTTISDRNWATLHLLAEQQGRSVSEVIDTIIAQACATPPLKAIVDAWFETHTLEETLAHLQSGREKVVPKAQGSGASRVVPKAQAPLPQAD